MFPSNVKQAAIFPANEKQAAIFPANEKKTANSQRVFDMSNCLHLILTDRHTTLVFALTVLSVLGFLQEYKQIKNLIFNLLNFITLAET